MKKLRMVCILFSGVVFLLFACSKENESDPIVERPSGTDEGMAIPDLRVMTFNIHLANPPSAGEKRDLPAIARVIQDADPDLVALQEVDVYTQRSGTDVHQAKELGKLTHMHSFYIKAMDVFNGGWYGIAILSKFPILDSVGYDLPPAPGVGGEMRKLGVVRVSLTDGRTVVFASTHLDHKSEDNRLYQGKRLWKVLEDEPGPVILAGDYNALPGSLTIDFFDEHFTRTCKRNCAPTFPASNPKSAIDFIMHRKKDEVQLVSQKVLFDTYGSDHLPVIADFVIQ